MLSITITDRSGAQRSLAFHKADLSIGRVEGNDLVLGRSNVSKRHARLVAQENRYILSDLNSTNGTFVNGRRIASPVEVHARDKVYIGDFILGLVLDAPELDAPGQPSPTSEDQAPIASAQTGVRAQAAQGSLEGANGTTLRPPPMSSMSPSQEAAAAIPSAPPTRSAPPPPPIGPSATEAAPRPQGSVPPSATFSGGLPNGGLPSGGLPGSASVAGDGHADNEYAAGSAAQTTRSTLAPAVRMRVALATLMERLGERVDVSAEQPEAFGMTELATLDELLQSLEREGVLSGEVDRRFLREAAISEGSGLGPLDALLRHDAVRDVIIDHPGRIVADLGSGLAPVSSFFSSVESVRTVVRRLFRQADRVLSTETPSQEALLPDGTHVSVLLPPLTTAGPVVSLRRPLTSPPSAATLAAEGVMSGEMLRALRTAVQQHHGLLVTGPSQRDVSILCAALAGLIAEHERVAVLHGGPKIAVGHPQVLSLTRLGTPEASLEQLLGQLALLRSDRLVVDSLRPQEALPLLTLAEGAQGLIVGMVAPNPALAISQLQSAQELQQPGSREVTARLLAHAFDQIVHLAADTDGSRRVVAVAQIGELQGERLQLVPRHRYEAGRFQELR